MTLTYTDAESLVFSGSIWQQQSYGSGMNCQQALEVANTAVFAQVGRRLSEVETAILMGAWQSQTYEQIASASGYSVSYLTRDVGPKLWKLLSQALGESVSKTNFRAALERQWRESLSAGEEEQDSQRAGDKGTRAQVTGRDVESAVAHSPHLPIAPSARHGIHGYTDGSSSVSIRSSAPHPRSDWGEAVDVSLFYGRTSELATLEQWIRVDRCRLVAVLGMGGIGKTALSVKLAQQIQDEFDFVIWRSLRHAPPLKTLLSELVPFLSDQGETKAEIGCLLQCLRKSRCLVILDNAETILQPGDRAGHYRPGYEDYGELLGAIGETAHQSCLILTSREKLAEVAVLEGVEYSVRSWQLRGSWEAAQVLIQAKGLSGSPDDKQQLCDRYGCNPLALKIVASSIQDLFNGEIGQFLEQNTTIFNGIRRLLDQHFARLSPLEKTIMYWLAIHRDWTTVPQLAADIVPSVSRADLLAALESLRWRSLIEKQSGSYTLQPVLMEYVTDQLNEEIAQEPSAKRLSLRVSHTLMKTPVKDYKKAA